MDSKLSFVIPEDKGGIDTARDLSMQLTMNGLVSSSYGTVQRVSPAWKFWDNREEALLVVDTMPEYEERVNEVVAEYLA